MMNWLRTNKYASGLLLIIRLYLGYEWFIHGLEKVRGGAFDATGFLNNIIANPVKGPDGTALYPIYNSFIETIALPNVGIINILIPWGEVLVGLGLLLGLFTTAAVVSGLLMNFLFVFGGTVSTNPAMIILGFIILAAGANAGKLGGDYYLLPWIKGTIFKNNKHSRYSIDEQPAH